MHAISYIKKRISRVALTSLIRSAEPKLQLINALNESDTINALNLNKVQFIFLDYSLEQESLLRIIGEVKKFSHTISTVLIVSEEDAVEDEISKYIALGFTGILIEPFSIEGVSEALQISSELKMKGSFARLTVATKMQVGALRAKVKSEKTILKQVNEACHTFEKENPGRTINSLTEDLKKMDPAERLTQTSNRFYSEVSSGIKKLIDKYTDNK